MCGRFALSVDPARFEAVFGVPPPAGLASCWNVTPGVPVCAVLRGAAGREAAQLEWGLVPPWAGSPRDPGRQINARSETAATKPVFRDAFRRRRCLIPATGFYEWATTPAGRQPWFVARRDGRPIGFAGLWQRLRLADGGTHESCAILTTAADALLAPLHPRMPVMLPEAAFAAWLDPALTDGERAAELLRPLPPEALVAYPVSPRVNSPRHDDPSLAAPLGRTAVASCQGTLF